MTTKPSFAQHKVQPVAPIGCNVLDTIGNTPLVSLNRSTVSIPAQVFAKVEAFNPGQSHKDRIALYIVERIEQEGLIRPGGTIIESTSGNTGFSLALVCKAKGYRCVLAVTDKASAEKVALLQAAGAEVHICPSKVPADDPQSYYSVAKRLNAETENSYYVNQYFNPLNVEAHYFTLGPEIWRQTHGKITHYVCCVGTGGSISGPARFLKEMNPEIQVIGVDAYGSVLKKYYETGVFDEDEIYPYTLEGVGKNIIPSSVEFELIDRIVKVTDRDAAWRAREMASLDALMLGHSSGAALQGIYEIADMLKPTDIVVMLASDHGSRYLSKIYSDDWMRKQGFM